MKSCKMIIFGILFLTTVLSAQKRIAIAPIHAIGLDESAIVTTEMLLKMDLENLSDAQIIQIAPDAEVPCYEESCALELGKNAAADEVVLCRLSRLGEKIIVQYIHLDVKSGKTILADNTISYSVEDLDTVIKRVAMSIVRSEPLAKTAQVGTITEVENQKPLRRAAHKTSGFSFGYLYPQNGYDNIDDSFAIDFRAGYDIEKWSVGMQFASRKGFATNIYTQYLLTQTDICPYIGGAFGFHWVSHENAFGYWDEQANEWLEDNRENDGFEIALTSGIRLFRTYNFQIMINLDYTITFNDYNDKAFVFTLGLLR